MSLFAEKKKVLQEIKAGVHLVTIMSIKRLLDHGKNQVVKDGEIGVTIQFATGHNHRHEQVYWIGKGKQGREKYFTSMCIDAGVDMSQSQMSTKAVIGKTLWIAVKEIYTLKNDGSEVLKNEVTGEDVMEHFIFKTAPVYDPDRPPTWPGDPAKNEGRAMDDFLGYKYDGQVGYDILPNPTAELVVEEMPPDDEIKSEIKVPDGSPVANEDNVVTSFDANTTLQVLNAPAKTTGNQLPNFDEEIPEIKETAVPEVKTESLPNFLDESPDTNF